MRWHKAHRNRKRTRRAVRLSPRYFMRNPDIGWQEWLDKILPTVFSTPINENSVIARLMRRPEPLATYKTQLPRLPPFRGIPYYIEPDPRTLGAFQGQSRYFTVVDDIDFSKPMPPKPTKRFIYGDSWVAYRKLDV